MTHRRYTIYLIFLVLILTGLAVGLLFSIPKSQAASGASSTIKGGDQKALERAGEEFGKLPLSFVENKGQTDARVKFISSGGGVSLFLTANEAVMVLTHAKEKQSIELKVSSDDKRPISQQPAFEQRVLRMEMVGANKTPRVSGLEELPGKVNYLIGNDPTQWHTNLQTFAKVRYEEVYPGINLIYYGNQRRLEYDFVVAAGADPRAIRLKLTGADHLKVNQTGDLVIDISGETVTLHRPFMYQAVEDGGQQEVDGRYVIKGDGLVVFDLKKFDTRKPLVIDPVLSYSTEIGSGGHDYAYGIAVDSMGSAYVTGYSDSSVFPTTSGSLKPTTFFSNAFVTKLNPEGTALVYSTYLGGNSSSATAAGIAVDSSGSAYVTGWTTAADFPTVNAVRGGSGNLLKSGDAGSHWANQTIGSPLSQVTTLVADPLAPNVIYAGVGFNNTLNSGGIYKSVDGGSSWSALNTGLTNAACSAIVIDPSNTSTIYAALNAANSASGVYKSTDGGNSWTSINSGLGSSTVSALAIDPKTPSTLYAGSSNFGLYKTTNGGASWTSSSNGINYGGFYSIVVDPVTPTTVYATAGGGGVFKTSDGGANWSQFNAGLSNTTVRALAIDPTSTTTLYAGTAGGGVFKTTNGGSNWATFSTGLPANAPVASLSISPAVSTTLYLGTSNGKVYKTTDGGNSWSKLYETLTSSAINTLTLSNSSNIFAGLFNNFAISDYEAFVSKLNPQGSALVYSTYLGGSGNDYGNAIALDSSGSAYVTGRTASSSFILANAFQSTLKGAENAFVTKLDSSGALAYSTYLGGSGMDAGNGIAVDSSGLAYLTGTTSSADFPSVNPIPGTTGGIFVTKFNQTGTALVYSTRLGGGTGYGIAVDSTGNAYVTGSTTGGLQTTSGAFQTAFQGGFQGDAFATKINPAGSALIYSTYLGGANNDSGRGIAIDSSGNAYITGNTDSVDYPLVMGALQTKSPFFKSTDGAASFSNNNYGIKGDTITALDIDPKNPSTIYAGTRTGIFKSTDGGNNWIAINNGLGIQSIVAVAVDPVTPSTIYLASGSIYKSTDGGDHWSLANNGIGNFITLSLAIDPVTPSTLYVGTYGGPIYKTVNSASNWTAISNTQSISFFVSFAINPLTPSTIYGASSMSGGGIFRSTDNGATWQNVGGSQLGQYGNSVTVNPVNPSIVYASAGNGLFRSNDGGNSWTLVRTLNTKVIFDPVNPFTIYLLSSPDGLLKSTNDGVSWKPVNQSASSLVVNPARPSTIYIGSSGSPSSSTAFVTKLNPTGSALTYSTLLNGGVSAGIALDQAGNAYVDGSTAYADFLTTPDSYQPFNRGYDDVFVAKLGMSYVISGRVTDGNASPLSGAEVTLTSGGQLSSVLTESDGSYLFPRLPEGGSFTVSVAKAHYTFTPPSQSFNNLNSNGVANFTATATNAPFYTISGYASDGGMATISGVRFTLSGSQIGATTGNGYSFTVPGGGNYTVTPSAPGFSFNPASQTFNNLSADQTADFVATRQNFVVTNTNDYGAGSLRQAILDANSTPGSDTIVFNIPGSGVKTIAMRITLPDITDSVTIDGTTQPGFAGSPLIELNGSNATASNSFINGLTISAGNCTVRGLIINSFTGYGILINAGGSNVIQGNYIGLDPTGTIRRRNNAGIEIYGSSNNLIGGTTPGARNVISANSFDGIAIIGSNNQVQGNFIGTDVNGTAAMGNGTNGVEIYSVVGVTSTNNLIGGTTPGARNIISGNSTGVNFSSAGNTIQGNFIGTDLNGTAKVGNGTGISTSAANTLIGGTIPEARNIISGNNGVGVSFGGSGSKLQGNFIGTDVSGTLALGNNGYGVTTGNNSLVGGTVPEARNVISANGAGNISVGYNSTGSGATVQGNFIGTDRTGTVALNNPGDGVSLQSSNNLIGGTTPGARNVISGNRNGVQIGGLVSPGPTGNVVQGNYIGTNAVGDAALPNVEGVGISLSSGNTVGGTVVGAGNLIAFNKGNGVSINTTDSSNAIRRNSIFANTGLGIDLGFDGVTPNDLGDSDTGANNQQNFPVLTSVTSDSGSTTIQGTLNSVANAQFVLEFFSNANADPSDFGEGQSFIGTTTVTTDAGGNASFNITFPLSTQGQFISATASDSAGNTSEFSACIGSGVAGKLQFNLNAIRVDEGAGSATISVTRTLGTTGTVTVDYATSDGTAKAGSDYVATSGTLTFAQGEAVKTFSVPLIDDTLDEFDETVNLTLSNPTGGAALGSQTTSVLTIADNDPLPNISISDASVGEWDAGTHPLTFTITLSAASGKTVIVSYVTANGTALAGSDYQSTSGTVTFNPGETVKTISVLINGDTVDEPDETFFVNLTGRSNGNIVRGQGKGTIVNDDFSGAPKFQFSSASYSVNEADGHATITVVRSGDTTSSATVDYATSDTAGLTPCSTFNGVASSRCDYASTVGTLQFASGETSKTIFIPVVDDSYAEGNENFTVNLNKPTGATLGSIPTATITIVDNDTATGGNPIVDSQFFIRQQYIDFLGREPDPGGLAGWTDVLNNCGTKYLQPCDRIEVSAGFFRSPEFQDRGYFIFRFYPVALGRNPNYSEFMPDLAKVSGFLTDAQLEANKVAFVNEFITRTEYLNRYNLLTDSAFVDALLQSCGLPNHSSKDGWKAGLANNSLSRAQVLRQLVESKEVYDKFYNQSFVVMQYFGYLRRDPDILYLQWIDIMNKNGGDYRTMINGFMNSSEYFLRFGP